MASSCCDFVKWKKYDQRTKDIVQGYTRQCQSLFMNETSSYFNIPTITICITTLYYAHNEYFASYGDKLITNDSNTIINVNNAKLNEANPTQKLDIHQYKLMLNSAFGNVIIDGSEATIYEWSFKVRRISTQDHLGFGLFAIGIDSSDNDKNSYFYNGKDMEKSPFFAIHFGNSIKKFCKSLRGKKYAQIDGIISDNHTEWIYDVVMIINVNNGTIEYKINDVECGIAFDEIDFKLNEYRMAITIDHQASIELIDYHQK